MHLKLFLYLIEIQLQKRESQWYDWDTCTFIQTILTWHKIWRNRFYDDGDYSGSNQNSGIGFLRYLQGDDHLQMSNFANVELFK